LRWRQSHLLCFVLLAEDLLRVYAIVRPAEPRRIDASWSPWSSSRLRQRRGGSLDREDGHIDVPPGVCSQALAAVQTAQECELSPLFISEEYVDGSERPLFDTNRTTVDASTEAFQFPDPTNPSVLAPFKTTARVFAVLAFPLADAEAKCDSVAHKASPSAMRGTVRIRVPAYRCVGQLPPNQ